VTTLPWADWWTRQKILNAVTAKFTAQDHLAVRHMLDRGYLQRKLKCAGTREDYRRHLDQALEVDAMKEEYPL
jgi:hypothetical protein